ncbi:MAG: hypothetical protein HXY53_09880 [Nitrospirae bacterium]|nr:hypothetical protein [Nitrospirota bacterium]
MCKNTEIRQQMAEFRSKSKRAMVRNLSGLFFLIVLFTIHFSFLTVYATDNPFLKMRDEAVSYFKPLTGTLMVVEGKEAIIDLGRKDSVKAGMRFSIFREEAPFKHPVTKEPLGFMESFIGKLEVKEVYEDKSSCEIINGDVKVGDRVRISAMQVDMLFYQSPDIDWYIADIYYKTLKDTNRFRLIDTDIETYEIEKIIKKAKELGADVVLFLSMKEFDNEAILQQKLFWTSDSVQFSEISSPIGSEFLGELSIGDKYFKLSEEKSKIDIDMPIDAFMIAEGDIDGNGQKELVVSTDRDILIFTLRVDLQPALDGMTIKGSSSDNIIWLDTLDLNRNGKDEIIITKMQSNSLDTKSIDASMSEDARGKGSIVSFIYELRENEFVLLYKNENTFFRKVGNELVAQKYSLAEGYEGNVFRIIYEDDYKKGDNLKLPEGVNIYDFLYINDLRAGKLLFSYDEKGFLNLYNTDNVKLWRSKTNTGGFLKTFNKSSPTIMVDRGEWSVKDRLFLKNNKILFIKRIPLLEMVKGIGYRGSQIRTLSWNGLLMEEGVLIKNINGNIHDFIIDGNKVIVLNSPMLGLRPTKILKGENPFGKVLTIYSMKGI